MLGEIQSENVHSKDLGLATMNNPLIFLSVFICVASQMTDRVREHF